MTLGILKDLETVFLTYHERPQSGLDVSTDNNVCDDHIMPNTHILPTLMRANNDMTGIRCT